MTTERNLNGSITVYAVIKGYLVRRTYYGYSVRDAKRMFKAEVER